MFFSKLQHQHGTLDFATGTYKSTSVQLEIRKSSEELVTLPSVPILADAKVQSHQKPVKPIKSSKFRMTSCTVFAGVGVR